MSFSPEELVQLVQIYLWPFLRVSAMMLAAPIFSASYFNVRVRIILGLTIAVLVVPL